MTDEAGPSGLVQFSCHDKRRLTIDRPDSSRGRLMLTLIPLEHLTGQVNSDLPEEPQGRVYSIKEAHQPWVIKAASLI